MLCRAFWVLVAIAAGAFAQKPSFDVDALLRLARISDPQISPDGRTVSFTAQTIDVPNNKRPKQIYVVPLAGGTPRRITDAGDSNERARWSPDSKSIAFVSDRGGSSQIWMMNADGSSPKQVTILSTEADGVIFSRDGKNLVFSSQVYPECTDEACNKQKLEADKNTKATGRIYDTLLYRHWNHWQSKRRSHLMVVPISGGAA